MAIFDPHVAAIGPAQLLKPLPECPVTGVAVRIVGGGAAREHADSPHALALLRPRRQRPRHRAADQRDEGPPPHSITSSARASMSGGTSRPSVFAVLRLITNSYLPGACTGMSPGLAPLRIRST